MKVTINEKEIEIDKNDMDLLRLEWDIDENGFFYINKKGTTLYLHQIIMNRKINEYTDGKGKVIFFNDNRFDFRRNNILFAQRNVLHELKNYGLKRKNGVSYNSRINKYEVVLNFGLFDSEEEAAQFYSSCMEQVLKRMQKKLL